VGRLDAHRALLCTRIGVWLRSGRDECRGPAVRIEGIDIDPLLMAFEQFSAGLAAARSDLEKAGATTPSTPVTGTGQMRFSLTCRNSNAK